MDSANALQSQGDDVRIRIDRLCKYASENLMLADADVDWKRNQLLGLFESRGGRPSDDEIMGLLSPSPSVVHTKFAQIRSESGGTAAMKWLYDFCVSNSSVKRKQLEENPRFSAHGLVITINSAKPEFKNMAAAATGNRTAGGFAQCTICHENEGFSGNGKQTLRTVPLRLGGMPWFWQFSPYGYFNEHGICVNMKHTPMHVDRQTFSNLLEFVDQFPTYFLGCNAALPRIGGSVLAHDHYQGGGELLPLHRAGAWARLTHPDYSGVALEILDWPGTAVRVVSSSSEKIVAVSDVIRKAWIHYSNPELGITAEGADGKHSAVSPSVLTTQRGYEMSLIFRNNGVNEHYPDGIFHVHPEFYAIKQEPIGLIEAQGLFILPGRLVHQLDGLEEALASGEKLPPTLSVEGTDFRLVWAEVTRKLRGEQNRQKIREALHEELGSICYRILENTAVFKDKKLTLGFLKGLGFLE